MGGTFYDDAVFGVMQRKWFGLTTKWGGSDASAITWSTHGATVAAKVSKWYPKGPIKMVKFGVAALATITNASGGLLKTRLYTRGASASVGAAITMSTCTVAPFTIASSSTFTVSQVKAGEYVTIKRATTVTKTKGTAIYSTVSGSVAFFIDYVPRYDGNDKWSV